MAPEHQYYKEVNSKDGAYYRRWASSIGPYMGKLIDSVLLTPQHEEQAYNSCNGILHMWKISQKHAWKVMPVGILISKSS